MIRLLYEEEDNSPKEQLDKILKSVCGSITRQFPTKAKEMLTEEGYIEQGDTLRIIVKSERSHDRSRNHSLAQYYIHNLPFRYDETDKIEDFIKKVLQKVFPKATDSSSFLRLPNQPLTGINATKAIIIIKVRYEMLTIEVFAD